MLTKSTIKTKPAVHVAEGDYERLSNLAQSHGSLGARLLASELERAVTVPDAQRRKPFVRLGSWVEYRDLPSDLVRTVQIVPPDAADIDQNRLSVVTPVGAALIGLSPGAAFRWEADNGRLRGVEVLSVKD